MKQQMSSGAAAGIIVAVLIVVGALGYMMYSRPPGETGPGGKSGTIDYNQAKNDPKVQEEYKKRMVPQATGSPGGMQRGPGGRPIGR